MMLKETLKSPAFLFIFLVPFLFTSCQKKWKKPTDVSFSFRLSDDGSSLVKFTGGYMILNELEFSGIRKQGENNVQLKRTFENLNVNLSHTINGPGISFEVPQGTYTSIELELEMPGSEKNPAIRLNGIYTDSLNNTIPVRLDVCLGDVINLAASPSAGGTEIVLVEDKPSGATIILNPAYWFSVVTSGMLNKAERKTISGVSTILINDDENEKIYSKVIGQFKQGNSAVFY